MSARRPAHDTRQIVAAILWLQIVLALVLFGADLMRVIPRIALPSKAPGLTEPTRPGDQTRRYDPEDLPRRESPPGARPVPQTEDMPSRLAFELADWQDGEALTLTGTISPGDADRFAEWRETHEIPGTVFLNSTGGSVSDALSIGRQLRGSGAATRMSEADVCLSACPYLLASGTERHVAEGAMVGIHQHYFGENTALPAFLAVEDIQRGQGAVMAYLEEMGIDPLIMQPALITPPDEIYLLTPEEMRDYGLVSG